MLKRTFFVAKNVKNLQNINLVTIEQVFAAIDGILTVKLVGTRTKIKVLFLNMQKLQPKMCILTTVYITASENPSVLMFFKIFFADVVFPPK